VVIRGNGLDENGHAHLNLSRSSLKGEVLDVFNDKAVEQKTETKDTHIKCLCPIMEHVFPEDNPLQKHIMYVHNHVFFHLNDKQVSKFCALWKEINNRLDEFLPFKPSQYFMDDQVKEILYSIIPKHWKLQKSYLQCEDKFDKICMMMTRFACNRAIESSYWRMDNDSDVGLLTGYVLYWLPVTWNSWIWIPFPIDSDCTLLCPQVDKTRYSSIASGNNCIVQLCKCVSLHL
jgi:hypothetical protein